MKAGWATERRNRMKAEKNRAASAERSDADKKSGDGFTPATRKD
jgi:hypothetical protein